MSALKVFFRLYVIISIFIVENIQNVSPIQFNDKFLKVVTVTSNGCATKFVMETPVAE